MRYTILSFCLIWFIPITQATAQSHIQSGQSDQKETFPTEDSIYKIENFIIPEGMVLEVSGITNMPDGRVAVSTRRGEIWIIENPDGDRASYKRFASGLHDPLGLAYRDGHFYVAQRAELTKISDVDHDDKADDFETVCVWPLSGNYCEYNHGPVIDSAGNFYINMNLGDNAVEKKEPFFGEMGSHADWRGWMMKITPDGKLIPYATGQRSPAGIGMNAEGDIFYTENQGGWVGTGYITHAREGDFFGHPSGLKSTTNPASKIKLKPSDIPTNEPLLHEAAKQIPGFRMPSIRIPHGIMGISTCGFVTDVSGGKFGPFENQVFIGDEGHANVVRVFLEKVNGEYQGAVFPFRKGFASGVLRLSWSSNNSLLVGMSDRGWRSTGPETYGLQRLVWTGKIPFEIKTIKAKPDGFELEFTSPVDSSSLMHASSYKISGFDYLYHETYGSEVQDKKNCVIKAVKLSPDKLTARLVVEGLRPGYIHEIKCEGVRSAEGMPLLHDFAYYSLNAIPSGSRLLISEKGIVKLGQAIEDTEVIDKKTVPTVPLVASKHLIKMPSSWKNGPDKRITINAKAGMKYDLEKFTVKPGSRIRLDFNNTDDMQHNLVIVTPGKADEVGKEAMNLGLDGPQMQYVPKDKKVLYHTKLLQPQSGESIFFTAPITEGEYSYICSYPGHYLIMRGIMKVGK